MPPPLHFRRGFAKGFGDLFNLPETFEKSNSQIKFRFADHVSHLNKSFSCADLLEKEEEPLRPFFGFVSPPLGNSSFPAGVYGVVAGLFSGG
ncbi:hypothetical protein M0R45_021002 [Rubus argutus]|uniref:Uncharacterized protein n=1 Tax=Rubus argutus TaxID=59490 RepID=A0AAW1XDL4_RUBAR